MAMISAFILFPFIAVLDKDLMTSRRNISSPILFLATHVSSSASSSARTIPQPSRTQERVQVGQNTADLYPHMCQNVRALSACSNAHQTMGQEQTRLKEIHRCQQAIQRQQTCPQDQNRPLEGISFDVRYLYVDEDSAWLRVPFEGEGHCGCACSLIGEFEALRLVVDKRYSVGKPESRGYTRQSGIASGISNAT